MTVVDSGAGGSGDGAAGCPVEASLGAFDPLETMDASHFAQPPAQGTEPDPAVRALGIAGRVDAGGAPPIDLLAVELWDGFGAFGDGQLEAGEYAIEGPEANLISCGVCIYLLGNASLVGEEVQVEKQYIATGGTVVIDSAGTRKGNEITGNFTGSINGLTMVEVGAMDGSPLEGGCETTIESITWDAAIVNGDEEAPAAQ